MQRAVEERCGREAMKQPPSVPLVPAQRPQAAPRGTQPQEVSQLLQQLRSLLSVAATAAAAASNLPPVSSAAAVHPQHPQLDLTATKDSASTLQDLMSASEEKGGIERLVDELCAKLKAIQSEGGVTGGGEEGTVEAVDSPPSQDVTLRQETAVAEEMECCCYGSSSSATATATTSSSPRSTHSPSSLRKSSEVTQPEKQDIEGEDHPSMCAEQDHPEEGVAATAPVPAERKEADGAEEHPTWIEDEDKENHGRGTGEGSEAALSQPGPKPSCTSKVRVPFYQIRMQMGGGLAGSSSGGLAEEEEESPVEEEEDDDEDRGSSRGHLASDESEGYHGDLSSRDTSEEEEEEERVGKDGYGGSEWERDKRIGVGMGGGLGLGAAPRLRLYQRKGSWASSSYSPPSQPPEEEEEEEEEEEGEEGEGNPQQQSPEEDLAQLIAKFNQEVAALWPPRSVASPSTSPLAPLLPPLHSHPPLAAAPQPAIAAQPPASFIPSGTNLKASIWSSFLPTSLQQLPQGSSGEKEGEKEDEVREKEEKRIKAIWAQLDNKNWAPSCWGKAGVEGEDGVEMEEDEVELEGLLEAVGLGACATTGGGRVEKGRGGGGGTFHPLNHSREKSCFVEVIPGFRMRDAPHYHHQQQRVFHHHHHHHHHHHQQQHGGKKKDKLKPDEEEENLLTSPRTHFRPIGNGGGGGKAAGAEDASEELVDEDLMEYGEDGTEEYEDGTTFHLAPSQTPVRFVRSASGGCLYQEGLLQSPRPRFQVYGAHHPSGADHLQPKFRLRQHNEKWCQTEGEPENLARLLMLSTQKQQSCAVSTPLAEGVLERTEERNYLHQVLARCRQTPRDTAAVDVPLQDQLWGQQSLAEASPVMPQSSWLGWWSGGEKKYETETEGQEEHGVGASLSRQLREEISAESEQLLADIERWQRLGALGCDWAPGKDDGDDDDDFEDDDDSNFLHVGVPHTGGSSSFLSLQHQPFLPMDLTEQHFLQEMLSTDQQGLEHFPVLGCREEGEGIGDGEREEEWVRKAMAARPWMTAQGVSGRHRSRRRSGKLVCGGGLGTGQAAIGGKKRPCSFFLEGNCRRSDCKFSHDLGSITCRFWEAAACLKGPACPFLHGYPDERDMGDTSEARHGFELESESDFPALAAASSQRMGCCESPTPLLVPPPPAPTTNPLSSAPILAPRRKRFRSSKSSSSSAPTTCLLASFRTSSRGDGAFSAPTKGERRSQPDGGEAAHSLC